jgi:hypothetical protein
MKKSLSAAAQLVLSGIFHLNGKGDAYAPARTACDGTHSAVRKESVFCSTAFRRQNEAELQRYTAEVKLWPEDEFRWKFEVPAL